MHPTVSKGASGDRDEATEDDFDADSMLSSPADIESAGRSWRRFSCLRP